MSAQQLTNRTDQSVGGSAPATRSVEVTRRQELHHPTTPQHRAVLRTEHLQIHKVVYVSSSPSSSAVCSGFNVCADKLILHILASSSIIIADHVSAPHHRPAASSSTLPRRSAAACRHLVDLARVCQQRSGGRCPGDHRTGQRPLVLFLILPYDDFELIFSSFLLLTDFLSRIEHRLAASKSSNAFRARLLLLSSTPNSSSLNHRSSSHPPHLRVSHKQSLRRLRARSPRQPHLFLTAQLGPRLACHLPWLFKLIISSSSASVSEGVFEVEAYD
ncbi:hypothetical protein TYRP_022898 [Tyrophagus putrescentiae]|nr:hypothetical protein TYRP_022898 [Tyrophagus putrescentiae]